MVRMQPTGGNRMVPICVTETEFSSKLRSGSSQWYNNGKPTNTEPRFAIACHRVARIAGADSSALGVEVACVLAYACGGTVYILVGIVPLKMPRPSRTQIALPSHCLQPVALDSVLYWADIALRSQNSCNCSCVTVLGLCPKPTYSLKPNELQYQFSNT